jgi:hypothetical protein
MPRELVRAPDWTSAGDKEPIPAGEFYATSVKADTEVTVWDEQVGQDQRLLHGHGPREKSYAEAFVALDLVDDAGNDIDGKLVLAITDSDQRRVLASTTFESLGQLRAASNQDRTDQIVEDILGPYAKPGRHLEIRVEATPGSDGATIDPAASKGNLYYTRVSA